MWRNQICCFKLALKDQWCKSLFIKSSSAFTSIARKELSTFTTTTKRAWNHSLAQTRALSFVAKTVYFYAIRFFLVRFCVCAVFSSPHTRCAKWSQWRFISDKTQQLALCMGPWHNFAISLFGLLKANFSFVRPIFFNYFPLDANDVWNYHVFLNSMWGMYAVFLFKTLENMLTSSLTYESGRDESCLCVTILLFSTS